MKKMLIALTAAVLVLTLLCGGALAATGDLTTKSVKAYSNAARTEYVGCGHHSRLHRAGGALL